MPEEMICFSSNFSFNFSKKLLFDPEYPILKSVISFFVTFLLDKYSVTSENFPDVNCSLQKIIYLSNISL